LKDQALQTFGLIRGALIMDTLKLNITNTVVVAALIAISMCMPVVAASLANHAGDSEFAAAHRWAAANSESLFRPMRQ
jgi:hypothetical protein